MLAVAGRKDGLRNRCMLKLCVQVAGHDFDVAEAKRMKEAGMNVFPISDVDRRGMYEVMKDAIRIAGEGTREFSRLETGDKVDLVGPLGNGFPAERAEGRRVWLIGGGIGIPPMLQLDHDLEEMGAASGVTAILGYRDEQFLLEDFSCECVIATEDGSAGTKGNVLDAIRENDLKADVSYACGPTPMLRALKEYALKEEGVCA